MLLPKMVHQFNQAILILCGTPFVFLLLYIVDPA